MFYRTDGPHGLPHNPFKMCVVPRPIGWITSLAPDGTANLAPYSYFNAVADEPPMVMFSSNGQHDHGPKDSVRNIEATGEFVCNVVSWDLREQMSETSAPVPPGVNEFDLAGLTMAPAQLVKPPRVKAAPIHLECVYHRTVDLPAPSPDERNAIVIGQVVGVHIDDSVLKEGLIDVARLRPVARLGYRDYAVVTEGFTMLRPNQR
jgi:flavin reductase (DIM6/NTAB) family NADH-FMN oxidoreductase RutF